MNFPLIAVGAVAAYILGYLFYGRAVSRVFRLDPRAKTPATVINDGRDFVPTRPAILLGQHFAAIAAVGPIAGPILAGVHYGWSMGLVWIVLGAVFIGAVHDLSALIASVRHGGRTIGDLMSDHLGRPASVVFSLFIWFSLLYVIVVFTDLTASAFVNRPELGDQNFGPGVATSSLLYLVLSVGMGIVLYRTRAPLWAVTAVGVPAIFGAIWLGQKIPLVFSGEALAQQRVWDLLILVYCFFASILPMWVLLQPRGYLGGFILYSTFAAGLIGIFFGQNAIALPAFSTAPASGPAPLVFPLLFTTIACGACSGFHGLVASGTTSKQIRQETDARLVGFGGMLMESLVAVIALATVMMLAPGAPEMKLGPDEIYARGMAHFMSVLGIPFAAGVTFGKLAFATFIYDTLDVSTRLGRYVIQELTGWKGRVGAAAATVITLLLPVISVVVTFRDSAGNAVPLWKIFWPAFGASNQLLAALTLAGVSVWLKKEGRAWLFTGIPAFFMSVVSLASLVTIIHQRGLAASAGAPLDPVAVTAVLLLGLSIYYLAVVIRRLFKPA